MNLNSFGIPTLGTTMFLDSGFRSGCVRLGWLPLLILAACAPQVGPRGSAGSAEAEILAASRAFSDAYVRGDTDAIADLYTEDAALLPPGGEVRGRSDIAAYFAPKPKKVNLRHAMQSSELKVFGDLAIDVGEWSNTWRMGDGDERQASGRYLVVWRSGADGKWRIAYDMWHRPSR